MILLRLGALTALAFSVAAALEYYGAGGTFCSAAGDCTRVRYLAGDLGLLLPGLGVLSFTTLFALSMLKGRVMARITAICAAMGALGAAYLVYLQSTFGAWCWLCLVIDTSAMIAGAAGIWLLAKTPEDESQLGPGLISFWWAPLWVVIFAPIIYGATIQDEPISSAITDLYQDDVVNIVEMADFECPYCRAMHPVLREAIEESGEDVHLVRIVVPLEFHERARPASAAYFCADREGRAEEMADELFGGTELSDASFVASAGAIGLNLAAFEACLEGEAIQARIEEDLALAERAGGGGLPTVYVGARTYRGFAPNGGPEPYIAAIAAAANGEGRRMRWWPSIAMLLLVTLSIVGPLRSRRAK